MKLSQELVDIWDDLHSQKLTWTQVEWDGKTVFL